MKGSHIGALNIYQAPIVGFAVKKLSLTKDQGQNWFKQQVDFDSDTEFQVRRVKRTLTGLKIIFERWPVMSTGQTNFSSVMSRF